MYFILSRKNIYFIIISLILVIIFTIFCRHFILAKKNTNWGLGFSKISGEQPTGNATPEYLKDFNAFFIEPKDEKKLYITFDAGYEAGFMPKILEALK